MKALLDTSVLIAQTPLSDVDAAISVISITELHFGLLVATDIEERGRRADRLAAVESTFDPIPVSSQIARQWGRLAAAVADRGGRPIRRQLDLGIAATAIVEGVPLLTYNPSDLAIIGDLLDARLPEPERGR